MILILSDPTPAELEILKRIIGDREIEISSEKLLQKNIYEEWRSLTQFTARMKNKGLNALNLKRERILRQLGCAL